MHTTTLTLSSALQSAIPANAPSHPVTTESASRRLLKWTRARRPITRARASSAASAPKAKPISLMRSTTSPSLMWEDLVGILLAVNTLTALLICAVQALNAVAAW